MTTTPKGRTAAGLLLLALAGKAHGALVAAKPSDVVTIAGYPSLTGACPVGLGVDSTIINRAMKPDGSVSPTFTIPAGKVLVVTGIEWEAQAETPGTHVGGQLYRGAADGSTVYIGEVVVGPSGHGSTAAVIPNAIIKSGTPVCFATTIEGSGPNVVVHGFLTTDR